MKKSLFIYLFVILGVLGLGGGLYFFARKRKKNKERSDDAPATGENVSPHSLTPEQWEKILKKEPRLATKITKHWYDHLKGLRYTFSSKEGANEFLKWLERAQSEILANKNLNKNLHYWINGKVFSPEASILRSFVLERGKKSLTRDDVERLASHVNDEDLVIHPAVAKLPSAFLSSEQTADGQPFDLQ